MEKTLYPQHPLCCVITGPSSSGKSVHLTNLNSNFNIEFDKINIHSPFLHQKVYSKKYLNVKITIYLLT